MYLTSLYLYQNKINAYANLLVTPQESFNKVYNRNLKIYRSVDNKIEIRVKNGDQRSVNIGDRALVFTLISFLDQKKLMKKDCEVRDSQQGIAFVDLTRDDLQKLETGFYQYNLTLESRHLIESGQLEYTVANSTPLYIDSNFGTISTLEVAGDMDGEFIPSTEVIEFTYVNPIGLGEPEQPFFFSSNINANPLTTTPQKLHTFQFYLTNYTGSLEIKASSEPQGASPRNWITIKTREFDVETTGTIYENVVGRYSWFRIQHFPTNISLPKDGPINVFGKIDKILYR